MTAASRVDKADDPARFSLVSQAHPWRHVFDYLTYVDPKGIAHPYLLDKWEASDDLKTWTLHLHQGVKFNNGKDFTADDVVFNLKRWLTKETGSSLLGQMNYMDANGVEKKDANTVICHLKTPTITLPYDLWSYNALIVPSTFGGDITREPIGTGAFTMKEFVPGQRAHLVRRNDYWRQGVDGKPLPYLDEVVFVMNGEDRTADLAALQSGQVDTVVEPPVTIWKAVKDDSRFNVTATQTSATRLLRMRADQDPWKDNRVRQALRMCHNRQKILALALNNQGVIGNDTHVAPVMPEFNDYPPVPFDVQKAKQLLAEAGHPNGLKVTLTVVSDWPESMAYAQALKEDAAPAGFDITLNTMPATQFWNGWTDFNTAITWWAHRPLATMVLSAAYTKDSTGKLVPWNESHWSDDEFDKLLKQAEATLDVPARKEIVGQMEKIMLDHGPIATPFFMNVWTIAAKKVQGIQPAPEEYAIYHEAWISKS